ncbi:MAG: N-acetylmuramoyl-L-alanine amidase [Acidobacteria bacterium]|nr:N-acetylmuramoyl-L-alanine amidase [Acidobacteriota bacterium]
MSRVFIVALTTVVLGFFATEMVALKIIDYQKKLNPRFAKRSRKSTRFIIIHSTEGSLPSSLRTLSRGKVRRRRYISRGGHAHYLVAKNGTVYRILDPRYRANHAGVSMWNGLDRLSDHSLGIELEGYHNVPFTDRQYRSLKELLRILQKRFRVKDRDVLEHYRIAYSRPNRFHKRKLRGRKKDPGIDNFDRRRAGLTDAYPRDPDVVAGRIGANPDGIQLARKAQPKAPVATARKPKKRADNGSPATAARNPEKREDKGGLATTARNNQKGQDNGRLRPPAADPSGKNTITARRTAWKIAGRQYKAATTLYRFPEGRSLRGHEIRDWSDIPSGTVVELGVEEDKVVSAVRAEVLLPVVGENMSPWKIANVLHNSSFTYYLYPGGKILAGHRIERFADVPSGTRVLIAYRRVPTPRTSDPLGEDLDDDYLSHQTLYLLPGGVLQSGEQIENFAQLPRGAIVFSKVE